MIERHFFHDKCLKTFDFNFGFCMPNSTNTCEHIYNMPELSLDESESHTHTHTLEVQHYIIFIPIEHELIAHPYDTKSDSFYFVDGQLVMHHKAEYAYDATSGQ